MRTQLFILASLVMFCAQPIVAMESQDKRHKVDQNDLHDQQKLNTKLLQATANGNLSKVTSYLKQGADVNAKNKKRQTPLMLAARSRNLKLCETLIEYGADVNARDLPDITSNGTDWGNLPTLHYATHNGAYQICDLLLAHGADPDGKNGLGTPALLDCIENIHDDPQTLTHYVKIFLAYGANANIQNATQKTPLMEAAGRGLLQICRLLIQYDANTNDQMAVMEAQRAWADIRQLWGDENEMDADAREETARLDAIIELIDNPEKTRAAIVLPDNPRLKEKFGTFKNIYHAIHNRELGFK